MAGDRDVNYYTKPGKGVPLMDSGTYGPNHHFGACLTPLPDKSLLVCKVGDAHPLGLLPGDVVLGYDGVAWKDLYPELLQAELPITGYFGPSPSAREHTFLMDAGMNWHLFDTIDILKYGTGGIQHLPASPLSGGVQRVECTEQMDLPGVPKPAGYPGDVVSWGILPGSRIGYIYVQAWVNDAGVDFLQAVRALTNGEETDGLIIDFRYNLGGNMFLSSDGLNLLFKDTTPTIGFDRRGSPSDHLSMVMGTPSQVYVINAAPDAFHYDRPIAVLTGPGAVSSGDQVALRMTFHPRGGSSARAPPERSARRSPRHRN